VTKTTQTMRLKNKITGAVSFVEVHPTRVFERINYENRHGINECRVALGRELAA
jgi:hypothetical protein